MRVAAFLEQQGFGHVANITGGINAWSMQVDPRVPRY
jgi:rhodanese-related sulfurtransferase